MIGGRSRLTDRLGGVLAHALKAEDGLGEDRAAAERGAEVESAQRHHRDQRIAERVAQQDAPLG